MGNLFGAVIIFFMDVVFPVKGSRPAAIPPIIVFNKKDLLDFIFDNFIDVS